MMINEGFYLKNVRVNPTFVENNSFIIVRKILYKAAIG